MLEKDSTVLVTGGAGFVGSHLVERLVELGARVTVIDDLSNSSRVNLQAVQSSIELLVGDLREIVQSKELNLSDYSYLFHLAGNAYVPPSVENPAFDFSVNLEATFHLLEALRKTKNPPRLLNVSSGAVYGNPLSIPIDEYDPTIPIAPYGVSKLAAERYASVYSNIYGLPATSVRFFSVYGPRQRKQVVFDLMHKLKTIPVKLEVFGDGTQKRDFLFVLDAIEAVLLAARKAPGKGEVLNVASGTVYTIAELVTELCRTCKVEPEIVFKGAVRSGDAQNWTVDIKRLRNLGFSPSFDLASGLKETSLWYDSAPPVVA